MLLLYTTLLVVIVWREILIDINGAGRPWLTLANEEILDVERSKPIVPGEKPVAVRGHGREKGKK